MIENIIYLSPLLSLLCGILALLFLEKGKVNNSRCFRIARSVLLISFFLGIIFYNKSLLPVITQGSHFTLLFESLLYLCAFVVLYLSKKWFMSMNEAGNIFCCGIFIAVLCGCLLIESRHLLLTSAMCVVLMLNNYMLLVNFRKKKEYVLSSKTYMVTMFLCWGLLAVALGILYYFDADFSYDMLKAHLNIFQENPLIFIAISFIVVVFFFLLGLAPLHFWFTEALSETILPVITYFILVAVVACVGGFIQLNLYILPPMYERLKFFYEAVALISVGVGAIGACSVRNIRKIFAYGTVYHLGILLLVLFHFTMKTVDSSFVYLFVYLLAMGGVCTTLFGLKIKGEYLEMLNEFSGAAYKRPYVAAMMTVFIFSLLGVPPFLGFLGTFSVLSRLAVYSLYELAYVLGMTLVLAYAYIQIIKTFYFEESKAVFDRADKGIYTVMLFNAILMLVIMVKPEYLVEDFVMMIETVFE